MASTSISRQIYEKFTAERERAQNSGYIVKSDLLRLVRGRNLKVLVRHIASQDRSFGAKSAELASIAMIRLYGSHDVPKAAKRDIEVRSILTSIRKDRVAKHAEGQRRNFKDVNGIKICLN